MIDTQTASIQGLYFAKNWFNIDFGILIHIIVLFPELTFFKYKFIKFLVHLKNCKFTFFSPKSYEFNSKFWLIWLETQMLIQNSTKFNKIQ